ncbi:MAG: hypothetical protein HQK50_19195 [Oligoflexia bacterium]|nr:hypothetical protein [Oligoflexia bacterium]MBF0367704.1 hypothetical protein [Oligoflexia bacterium]
MGSNNKVRSMRVFYSLSVMVVNFVVCFVISNVVANNSIADSNSFAAVTAADAKSAGDIIKRLDTGVYHAEMFGLKDLVVDLKFKEAVEDIGALLGDMPIEKMIIRVYWLQGGKIDAEVIGLPRGFSNLKEHLIKIALMRFGYVISSSFGDKLKSFDFKVEKLFKENQETIINGKDKNMMGPVSTVKLTMDNDGGLKELVAQLPTGLEISKFEWVKSNEAQNKWLLSSLDISMDYGNSIRKSETSLKHDKFAGFMLPTAVFTKTEMLKVELKKDKDGATRKIEIAEGNANEEKIIFDNYQINSGKAQKYFQKKSNRL